jgi:ferritin-like metal-binding protein YciE
MKLNEINDLYTTSLKQLHSTEKQLEKALGALAEAASEEDLKSAFLEHQEQTRTHIERIEQILEGNGLKAGRTKAKGIEAIIAEGQPVINADGEGWIKDLALIDAAQRTEHHEMSLYGCAATYAQLLGRDEDAKLLHQTLDEEEQTDERLTQLSLQCCAQAGGESGDGDEVEASAGGATQAEDEDAENSIQHVRRRAMKIMDERRNQSQHPRRRNTMPRRDYDDDRGYDGRAYGGQRSAQMQERDEYGQFQGYQGGGGGRGNRDYDDDRGQSSGRRYSSSRYDDRDNDRGGGYEGRSYGGQRSAQMQERDEYGQFAGYGGRGGGGRGGYDDRDRDYDRGSSRGYSNSGGNYGGNSGGGYGGNGGGRGDINDSAGRHYTRESWERAQEGRSLGGQHSHGGYR